MKFLKLEMAFIAVFAVMVFAAPKVWTGKLADSYDGGTGKKGDPYLISTAEQFALMASNRDSASYFKLTEDIILNEGDASKWAENPPANKWTVYGTRKKPVVLSLNGNSHKVSGLYVNSTDSLQGLFGVLIGTVTDLNLVNGYVKGGDVTGGLAGLFYENISKMSFYKQEVGLYRDSVDLIVEGKNYVGGFVGVFADCYPSEIFTPTSGYGKSHQNLVFSGSVSGKNNVGGIAGYETDSYADIMNIDCRNRGTVVGSKNVGGIFGQHEVDVPCGSLVSNIINYGTVKGDVAVGGVIGRFSTDRSGTDKNEWLKGSHGGLINLGEVSGKKQVGGVVGYWNHERSYPKLYHSYNAGSVFGEDSVGGIIGGGNKGNWGEKYQQTLDTIPEECFNFGLVVQGEDTLFKQKSVKEVDSLLPLMSLFSKDLNDSKENLGYPLYIPSHVELILPKGSGTRKDPYLISNERDLFGLSVMMNYKYLICNKDTLHFRQTADIAWSGKYDWFVDSLKLAYYDGGDHVISGMKINRPNQDTVGFFRTLYYAYISHLTLKDFEVKGRNFVGMLAGDDGSTQIHNMRFYGKVQGDSIVGGIFGRGGNNATNVLSFVDVSGKNMVGGMYGVCYPSLYYSASFGKVKGDSLVGGICGMIASNHYTLFKSVYAVNDVEARTHGGIVAYNVDDKEPPSTLYKLYYKKSKYDDYPWGVALDDSIMKSEAFLDSLRFFVKGTAADSMGYPVPHRFKGQGTAASPYLLENAEDLYFFDSLYMDTITVKSLVNNHYKFAHYKMTADINMNKNMNHKWIPITEFYGTLDGDYHVINNMNVMDTGAVAIFSSFEGSIKNLGIRNSYFWGTFAAPFAANFWGSIENCWNENTTVKGSEVAGGIVGRFMHRAGMKGVDSLKIENVYNTGNINSTHYAGGIMGSFVSEYSRDTNTYVISNVYNRGEITTFSGYGWIGQISSGGRALRIHLLKNSYNTDKMCSSFHIGDGFLETTFQNNYVLWNDECTIDWFPHFRKADYMQSADFVKELGDAFEMDKDGVNDGFPILKGLKPRTDYSPELDKTDSTVTIREVAKIENRMMNLHVESVGRLLNVNGVKPGSTLKVYDLKGTLVQSVQVNNKSVSLTVNKAGVLVISNAGRTRMVKVN